MAALFWLGNFFFNFNILFQIFLFVGEFITVGFYLVNFYLICGGCCVRLTGFQDGHCILLPKQWMQPVVWWVLSVTLSTQDFSAARGVNGVDFFICMHKVSLLQLPLRVGFPPLHVYIFTINLMSHILLVTIILYVGRDAVAMNDCWMLNRSIQNDRMILMNILHHHLPLAELRECLRAHTHNLVSPPKYFPLWHCRILEPKGIYRWESLSALFKDKETEA